MRRRLLAVLAVAVLVTLAGCAGAQSDAGSPTVTATETPNPTAAQSATTTAESAGPLSTTNGTRGPNGTLSVHFINVGQGSATLVVGPSNETMLVDTGDWTDDGEAVIAYLDRLGVERIDYLVTTHADADHIGGHAAVIEHFETEGEGVGAVYDPGIAASSRTYEAYLDAIEEHNVTLYEARAGDEIPLEGVNASILAPPEGYLADRDRNENSLVVHLAFGQSTFLLPGDAESAGERYLVEEYGVALNATVLSVGHHGSNSSSSGEFLNATRPRLAVVSSAYDSQYGHPHEAVLERLADYSVRTYWTATHGTVRVTTNGTAVTVATQRAAPTAPLDLRNGSLVDPGTEAPLENRTTVYLNGTAAPTPVADGGTVTESRTETTETSSSEGSLSVATVSADAAGNDHENLNDEYVVLENTGEEPLDLGGWTVSDAADHTYTFPSGFTLDAGAQVTLHTGSGTDTGSALYWGSGSAVWNNGGDSIVVRDDGGTTVLEHTYE